MSGIQLTSFDTSKTSIHLSGAVIDVKNVLKIGVGAVGHFTTPTGQIVTLQNGVITNIFSANNPLPGVPNGPPASTVYNPAFLNNIINQIDGIAADIDAINPCAALQALVNEVMAQIQAEINSIESQIAALNILVTIPTTLGQVIGWITNFISPYIQAIVAFIQQLEQMVQAIEALIAAIEAAASRITNCQISVAAPVISIPLPTVTVTGPTGTTGPTVASRS